MIDYKAVARVGGGYVQKETANRYLLFDFVGFDLVRHCGSVVLLHECAGRFGSVFEFGTELDAVDHLIVLIVVFGEGHYVVTAHSFPFDTHHKAIASSLERLSLVIKLWFDFGPSGYFVCFDLVRHCNWNNGLA